MGYAGGLACLGAALVFLVQPDHPIFGIGKTEAANIRATGPLVRIMGGDFRLAAFRPGPRRETHRDAGLPGGKRRAERSGFIRCAA